MPKRIVDGEGVWRSEKLANVPPKYRAEFANLIPLALANGSFELGTTREIWARRVHSIVYSFNRPEITPEKVEEILSALYQAKLLYIWYDAATSRFWGYWTGISKPGRLPSASRQTKKHEAIGAEPPADDLHKYLESTPESLVSQWLAIGPPMVSKVLVLDSASVQVLDKPSLSEADASDGESHSTSPEPSEAGRRIAEHLTALILRNAPSAKVPKNLQSWATEADRMLRLDKRTEAEVIEVMEWALSDSFWSANILSIPKLRQKFDTLQLQKTRKLRATQHTNLAALNYSAGVEVQENGACKF